jgi:hypothetical protein
LRLHAGLYITPSAAVKSNTYPASVDLSAQLPPVGDQGWVGSCVTWAEDYGVAGWWANKTGHAGAPYAPMYVYSQIQRDRGWSDYGAYSNDGYDYAAGSEGSDGGIDTQADYQPQGNYDWQDVPTAAQVVNAQPNRLNGNNWIFSGAGQGSLADDAIRNQLAQGRPVTIAFPVYSAWDNLDSTNYVLDANNVDTSTYRGGHEVMVYGYNSTGLLVQNSWGTGWGNAGRAIIAWNFVEQYVDDATYTTGWKAVPPSVVEETAAQYDGWFLWSDPSASGGSWRASTAKNNTASFAFSGSGVTWLSNKGPSRGIAAVTVDGVSKGTVDLYSAAPAAFSKAFGGLSTGKHTIVIKVSGTKNAASTGTGVVVDGFTVGTTTTQENGKAITYNTWKGATSVNASGGAYRSSGSAGAVAQLKFSGTSVGWVTAVGPGWGKAEVYIDNVDKGTVDLYASTAHWQTLKSYTGLAAGNHTIQVKVLGTKNASALKTTVPIDGFTVP